MPYYLARINKASAGRYGGFAGLRDTYPMTFQTNQHWNTIANNALARDKVWTQMPDGWKYNCILICLQKLGDKPGRYASDWSIVANMKQGRQTRITHEEVQALLVYQLQINSGCWEMTRSESWLNRVKTYGREELLQPNPEVNPDANTEMDPITVEGRGN